MEQALRVAVIGAGIGGLTLAAALARVGVPCAVFEQAEQVAEVGAGVQVAPNAVRLLHRLGLGPQLRARAVRPEAMEIRRWDDDLLLSRTTLGAECEQMYGAPYYTIHRAHLHEALLGLVGERCLRLGHRLVRVDEQADGVVLAFANGVTHTADVVVGADGIHSVVRAAIVQDAPVFSGHSIYRALVPADRLPELAARPAVRVWVGPGKHCVCYPVSAGRTISLAATTPSEQSAESWSAAGDPVELRAAYEGWNEAVSGLLRAVETVHRWALHDREPLARWSTGRITVLGDAAHPMLPFMAQGANQAVEDAAALAACLAGVRAPSDIPRALGRYEALRVPRTALVQRGSRGSGRLMHLADGADQRRRDATINRDMGLRSLAWLYGYDAERAAAAS